MINIGKHSLSFAYFDSESRPEDNQQSEMDKTMVMDTNEYRSMVEKNDPTPTAAAPPAPAPVNAKKKKSVRGYITYLAGRVKARWRLSTKSRKLANMPLLISWSRAGQSAKSPLPLAGPVMVIFSAM